MINILAYGLAGAATIIVGLWIFLFLKYRNSFDQIIEAIDRKQFMMPELFFVGFGFIDFFKVNINTELGRKKEKRISEIYGEKYAKFYHYCIVGAQITYLLTIVPIGLMAGAIANDLSLTIIALAGTVGLIAYLDLEVNNAVEKRHDEIISDYPEVLSKLTLLVNAGMVLREAWSTVADTSNRALYREMQATTEEMNNGVSEIDALMNFSQRCAVKEIRKFTSIITQNLQKGGTELVMSLRYMSNESWEEKKHLAKRKGESASQKLMVPLLIMFVGVLIMIIVPVFSNMF